MILISLFMVGFMLAFVVPQITGIFEGMGQELPAATRFVITLGDFFNNNFTIKNTCCTIVKNALIILMTFTIWFYMMYQSVMVNMLFVTNNRYPF